MVRVDLFGVCTLTSLRAMPPHTRAECLRLLQESGWSEDRIAATLGASVEAVGQVLASRHAYRLPSYLPPREAKADGDPTKPAPTRVTRTGRRLLIFLGNQAGGETALGPAEVARLTDMPRGSVDYGLGLLAEAGLVARLTIGRNGRPSTWRLTEAGVSHLLQMEKAP